MTIRLAAVISHPIPHFAPMFRELARAPSVDLKVFYCCKWGTEPSHDAEFGTMLRWDVPLLDGYQHEFLPIEQRSPRPTFWQVDNPTIGRALDAFQPDAVWVFGYRYRTDWRAFLWARRRAYTLYLSDSALFTPRPLMRRVAKRILLPRLFASCNAIVTIGDNNEAYYRHYGVPEPKLFRGAYPVDIRRFQEAVVGMSRERRVAIRREFGLDGHVFTVLFCGKFVARKRPSDLIRAMARITARGKQAQALFIGGGELEASMRDLTRELGVGDRVRIAGFVNQARMPEVLAAGDTLAMCSEDDPHPLAVTEAMAVGNVIVASTRVGCVGPTDSARPGENAVVYECGNDGALADALSLLIEDESLRARMSHASKELAMTQDISATVTAVVRALERARIEASK